MRRKKTVIIVENLREKSIQRVGIRNCCNLNWSIRFCFMYALRSFILFSDKNLWKLEKSMDQAVKILYT